MCVVTESEKIDKMTGIEATKMKAWPEDNRDLWWPYRIYQSWTFSFLSPLLARGVRQHKDGTRLGQEDLFEAPATLRSGRLSTKFR